MGLDPPRIRHGDGPVVGGYCDSRSILAVRTNFDPAIGPARLIFGFEAVIIGGLGSMWGTLAGGVILGVAQAVGAQIDPGWQLLAGHLMFLAILAIRPQGFFPKVADDSRDSTHLMI